MKLATLNIPFILFLSYNILITCAHEGHINAQQSATIEQNIDASQSAVIDVDQLLNFPTPAHITQVSSNTCQLQRSPFALTQQIPFTGSFSKSERAFILKGIHYVLKIDPESKQVAITSYKLKTPEDSSPQILIQDQRRVFTKKATSGTDIVDLQIYGNIVLVSTNSSLLVLSFADPSTPNLVQVYTNGKPIRLFTLMNDKVLYIAQENGLNAYDISEIGSVGIKDLTAINNYIFHNDEKLQIYTIRSMSTCDNIAFVAEDKQIQMFDGTLITADSHDLAILKTLSFDAEVIHIKRIGRSLVVMTAEELIEYVFLNSCLDLKENMRVPNTHVDVDPTFTLEDRISLLDLQGSDQGRYFALLNKGNSSIHVFQSGGIPPAQNASLPCIYTFKDTPGIHSMALYDTFKEDFKSNSFRLAINHNSQASVIVFKAERLFLICNSTLPIHDAVSIQAEARFCNNDVSSKNADTNYDPNLNCKRTVNLTIKYGWSTAMIVAAAVSGLAIVAIIVICVRKCQKTKKKISKYRGHKRFHNEKDLDQSNVNKIDISSLSLPAGTDRKGDSDVEADKKNANKDGNQRRKSQLKKSFSKKKNLSIKIPEN